MVMVVVHRLHLVGFVNSVCVVVGGIGVRYGGFDAVSVVAALTVVLVRRKGWCC